MASRTFADLQDEVKQFKFNIVDAERIKQALNAALREIVLQHRWKFMETTVQVTLPYNTDTSATMGGLDGREGRIIRMVDAGTKEQYHTPVLVPDLRGPDYGDTTTKRLGPPKTYHLIGGDIVFDSRADRPYELLYLYWPNPQPLVNPTDEHPGPDIVGDAMIARAIARLAQGERELAIEQSHAASYTNLITLMKRTNSSGVGRAKYAPMPEEYQGAYDH